MLVIGDVMTVFPPNKCFLFLRLLAKIFDSVDLHFPKETFNKKVREKKQASGLFLSEGQWTEQLSFAAFRMSEMVEKSSKNYQQKWEQYPR